MFMKKVNFKNILAGLGVVFILLVCMMVAFPAVASRIMKATAPANTETGTQKGPGIVEDDLDPF